MKRILSLLLALALLIGMVPAVSASYSTDPSNGMFAPDDELTRGRFFYALWNYFGSPEPASTENPFTDLSESAYYHDAACWALEEGITIGTSPTTFSPNSPLSRAQVITFLWRAFDSPEPAYDVNPYTDVVEGQFYYKAVLWDLEHGYMYPMNGMEFGVNEPCLYGYINWISDAQEKEENGFSYVVYQDHVDITKYTGTDTEVVIPTEFDDLPVTRICEDAFHGCSSLTSIQIPDSVTSIGQSAFYNCNSLTSIDLPDTLISIGRAAFSNCTSLTSIDLPDTLSSIGHSAFYNCTGLTDIVIPDGVTVIHGSTFSNCGSLTSIDLPDTLSSIGEYAFQNCKRLISIDLPDTLTSIGCEAFYDCDSLIRIDLPDSITTIEHHTFHHCDNLSSIDLPDDLTAICAEAFSYCFRLDSIAIPAGVTFIGDGAFYSCTSLNGFYVDANNPQYSSDDRGVLFNKEKTQLIMAPSAIYGSYTVPYGVTTIEGDAFYNCAYLTSISFPDSLTSLHRNAFDMIYVSDSLTSIYFNGDVPTIDAYAFNGVCATAYYPEGNPTWTEDVMQDYGGDITWQPYESYHTHEYTAVTTDPTCTQQGFTTYSCSCGATYVTDYADALGHESVNGVCRRCGCPNDFEYIVLGDHVEITNYTGSDAEVVIPSEIEGLPVTSIGEHAFAYCESMTSIVVPASVTNIDGYAFAFCENLTGIYVDENNPNYSSDDRGILFDKGKTILILAPGAFTGSYEIPDSVTTIGDYAFAYCESLTDIVIPDSVTHIGDCVFYCCYDLADIVMGDSISHIGQLAFYYCSSLTEIVIPSSVTFIHYHAFAYTSKLHSIRFEGNPPTAPYSIFREVSAIACYPAENAAWTEDVRKSYGGDITWVPYNPNHAHDPSLPHDYTPIVIEPTCTQQGFTVYICDCGYWYVADNKDALGHECEDGYCKRCGGAYSTPFTDVPPGEFYEIPVTWAVENGITTGTSPTTFSPAGQCLRAQVVTFLWRAEGTPEPSSTNNSFTDVAESDFFYKPVLWALEKGITTGISPTSFGSYNICNRAQVVTFLWRAAGSPEPKSTSNPFSDVKDTDFFYKPVLWAVENSITTGISATEFGPTAPCNRAQVVTFLYRAYTD